MTEAKKIEIEGIKEATRKELEEKQQEKNQKKQKQKE